MSASRSATSHRGPSNRTMVLVGAMALLSILTLSDDLAGSIGANRESLDIAGRTLVAIHDWTFLMGPGFCVGVNGLLLGYPMYSTGLMPPRLALFGIIGGPLLFASKIAVLFGAYDQTDGARRNLRAAGDHLRGVVRDLPDRQGIPGLQRVLSGEPATA